jgi:hypothetical protein
MCRNKRASKLLWGMHPVTSWHTAQWMARVHRLSADPCSLASFRRYPARPHSDGSGGVRVPDRAW